MTRKSDPMPHPASIVPSPYRPPTREQIERARAMYLEGFTVSRILDAGDMSLGTFYYWLDGGPVENGVPLYPPIPRRCVVVGKRRRPLKASRVSLAARMFRTAERQARDIEQRLAKPSGASPERERDVRMLTMLVRALRDLSSFDSAAALAEQGGRDEPALAAARDKLAREQRLREAEQTANTFAYTVRALRDLTAAELARAKRDAKSLAEREERKQDIDEVRRELARRIEGFAAARRDAKEAGEGQ